MILPSVKIRIYNWEGGIISILINTQKLESVWLSIRKSIDNDITYI